MMRYLLLAVGLLTLMSCDSYREPDKLRACRDACLPYGVKRYSSEGCECNRCKGEPPKTEPHDD